MQSLLHRDRKDHRAMQDPPRDLKDLLHLQLLPSSQVSEEITLQYLSITHTERHTNAHAHGITQTAEKKFVVSNK